MLAVATGCPARTPNQSAPVEAEDCDAEDYLNWEAECRFEPTPTGKATPTKKATPKPTKTKKR